MIADDILRDLVACETVVENYPATDLWGYHCQLCDGFTADPYAHLLHDAECPWLRASHHVARLDIAPARLTE